MLVSSSMLAFSSTNRRCRSAGFTFLSRVASIIFLFCGLFQSTTTAEIPPKPGPQEFLHDYANVIDDEDERTIREIQQRVFQEVQTPLVVVTVSNMRTYDPGAPSIESFAHRWFDTWGIGSQQQNDGILVIISTGDRKGRIELGKDWGLRFDNFSQRVMDNDMIPQFKKGDYSTGLIAAVESLSAMAISGLKVDPPEPSLLEKFLEHPVMKKFAKQNNPIAQNFGSWMVIVMIVAGLGCFVASYFLPEFRKPLIILGIVLIALAVIFVIVLFLFFIFAMLKGDWEGGGGGGSGGGFGGGSSGGGGASGSW